MIKQSQINGRVFQSSHHHHGEACLKREVSGESERAREREREREREHYGLERIERVKQHREKGNVLFRGGDTAGAAREYEMTLSFLTDDMMMQLFGKYLEAGGTAHSFTHTHTHEHVFVSSEA